MHRAFCYVLNVNHKGLDMLHKLPAGTYNYELLRMRKSPNKMRYVQTCRYIDGPAKGKEFKLYIRILT